MSSEEVVVFAIPNWMLLAVVLIVGLVVVILLGIQRKRDVDRTDHAEAVAVQPEMGVHRHHVDRGVVGGSGFGARAPGLLDRDTILSVARFCLP